MHTPTAFRLNLKLCLIATLLPLGVVLDAGLPEPDIVFYGRIVHLGGGEEYVLTDGTLTWTVGSADASHEPFVMTAPLQPLQEGAMSYLIRIPNTQVVPNTLHGVLPGLLGGGSGSLPFLHTSVIVNGMTTRMADPASSFFDLGPLWRGSHRRLDLIVEGDLPDSDGDGIPDWWEIKYGTGWDIANADDDPDGDGMTNLEEYLAGTHPFIPNIAPTLPENIMVSLPRGGKAVLMLKPVDEDSRPDQLIYTVDALPEGIMIHRAHNELPILTFDQAEVAAGGIIIASSGGHGEHNEFVLTLRDETPSNEPAVSTVHLAIAEARDIWLGHGLSARALPEPFPVIQDATRMGGNTVLRAPSSPADMDAAAPRFPAPDLRRIQIGGTTADTLLASAYGDVLVISRGHSARTGAGANAIHVIGNPGEMQVAGFDPAVGDTLNLSQILVPLPERRLSDYLRWDGDVLTAAIQGNITETVDYRITLPMAAESRDLAELWDRGALITDGIAPATTLFVTGRGHPEEEDLKPAFVDFRRRGAASEPLTVALGWSGTATMGLDYVTLPNSITFAAGQKELTLTIQPLADDIREPTETIILDVHTAESYQIAAGSNNLVFYLKDLPSRVWFEVTERVAFVNGQSPAEILLRRSGPLDASLTVGLTTQGSAIAGIDYRRLSSAITFAPGQTVRLLQIEPLASANLQGGPKEVRVSIVSDASQYELGALTQARAVLVQGPQSMAAWMAERGIDDGTATFAAREHNHGLSGLLLYAFNRAPDTPGAHDFLKLLPRGSDGRIRMEYPRWPSAPEIDYVLEWSPDLRNWSPIPVHALQESNHRLDSSGMETLEVSPALSTPYANGFYRISIQPRQ